MFETVQSNSFLGQFKQVSILRENHCEDRTCTFLKDIPDKEGLCEL